MFVTFSYGGEAYAKQALLCALSIRARRPEEVTVYTDRPAFFAGHGLTVRALSPIEVATLRGPLHYKHGVKLGILLRHALAVAPGAPVIYIDADTYHRGGEAGLRGRPLVMHHLDGQVSEGFYPRLNQFLLSHAAEIAAGPQPGLASGFKMYNSGLLGFAASLETVRFLHDAKAFTDWLCIRFPQQTDWLEQTAFSWIGENRFGVAVDPMGFDHYWNWNTEVAWLLGQRSVADIVAMAKDGDRFTALMDEAKGLQGSRYYRLTHRFKKRMNRSLHKRRTIRRARALAEPQG